MQKIPHVRLCWLMVRKDLKTYCRACDVCQRRGRASQTEELPLNPQITLHVFNKWVIDFVGPIHPPVKKMGARYIIITTEYLTKWVDEKPVKGCSITTTTNFIFEYILYQSCYPRILMSDRGTNFLNETIGVILEEFQVHHQKSMPCHPQDNGMVEAFNKILETALTKTCNTKWNDWDMWITTVLWTYRTTFNNLKCQTPFRLVYG